MKHYRASKLYILLADKNTKVVHVKQILLENAQKHNNQSGALIKMRQTLETGLTCTKWLLSQTIPHNLLLFIAWCP